MKKYFFSILSLLVVASLSAGFDLDSEINISSPEEIASSLESKEGLIGGLISPLTGQPSLQSTDLKAKGAVDFSVSRTFFSPFIPFCVSRDETEKLVSESLCLNYRGWVFFPHIRLQVVKETSVNSKLRITDSNGVTLDFVVNMKTNSTRLASDAYGLKNLANDQPGGQYDFRNTIIKKDAKNNQWIVQTPSGYQRFYSLKGRSRYNGALTYLLKKEILPNGKQLAYSYDKWRLVKIESQNPDGTVTYASVQIETLPGIQTEKFTTSSGLTSEYCYKQCIFKGTFKTHSYKLSSPEFLVSISSPYFKEEQIEYTNELLIKKYETKDTIAHFQYLPFGKKKTGKQLRVATLLQPISENGPIESTYTIEYKAPVAGRSKGTTVVRQNNGISIVYTYNKNLLLDSLQHYNGQGTLLKEKLYFWDKNQYLTAIEIRDPSKTLLKKSYTYDLYGNPTKEIVTGDLAGDGSIQEEVTLKEFSQDGRHLLLKEIHSNGKVISYKYMENTNLLLSKLTGDGGHVYIREFHKYDADLNLIETISDDGSSSFKDTLDNVSQRNITSWVLRDEQPFQHMPEWKIESYYDGNKVKLLNKIRYHYDKHGYVCQEDHYDASEKHIYSLHMVYNERGDLLSETNSLGDTATYKYDKKGNCTSKTNFSSRLTSRREYDVNQRLVKQVDTSSDGETHCFEYQYDAYGLLTAEIDSFQNITSYQNDPLVQKPIVIQGPAIDRGDNLKYPVITQNKYNAFGQRIETIDPRNHKTTYLYNARGQTRKIIHPDGSYESFHYTLKGKLSSYTDENGLSTHYAYDVLDHVIKKTYLTSEGDKVAEENYLYKGDLLIQEIDREGFITNYSYDGAGRKIKEDRCGQILTYTYDESNRLQKTVQHNGDNSLATHYEWDLANRLIQKTKSSLSGKVLFCEDYSYDQDGNRVTRSRYIHNQQATDHYSYDAFGRMIKHVDPLGNAISTQYNELYTNKIGQQVLRIESKDPLGRSTITTQDAYERTVSIHMVDEHDSTISFHSNQYDQCGNLTAIIDDVYDEGVFLESQVVERKYDERNREIKLTRAAGTSNERVTLIAYTPSGRVSKKRLPDGTSLHYHYDRLGNVTLVQSSDGSIYQTFLYSKLGYLLEAIDHKSQISIRRMVDPFGNVCEEHFSTGYSTSKTYDFLNRPLTLKIPKLANIAYEYDALYMRQVARLSSDGKVLYSHNYDSYDLAGNLLEETFPEAIGTSKYTYDKVGRKLRSSNSRYAEECSYDYVGNLIRRAANKSETQYSYNSQNQLVDEVREEDSSNYKWNSLYGPSKFGHSPSLVSSLNEISHLGTVVCSYDFNGNLSQKELNGAVFTCTYDALNRLIEATSKNQTIIYSYDALGRCLSRSVRGENVQLNTEFFLFDGEEDIGSFYLFEKLESFRVTGRIGYTGSPSTVAVEDGEIRCAALQDAQGNIVRLFDCANAAITNSYDYSAFGNLIQKEEMLYCPWRYASKRVDDALNLINFGKRFYDPELRSWVSTDPAGFIDSSNLYQFNFNNPFKYVDPTGEFAFVIPIFTFAFGAAEGAIITTTAATIAKVTICAGLTYYGYRTLSSITEAPVDGYQEIDFEEKVNNHKNKKETEKQIGHKEASRKRFKPDSNAEGAHTRFRRAEDGTVSHYQTFKNQTNKRNPNPWESQKRYDGPDSKSHYNDVKEGWVSAPHVHGRRIPGGLRPPYNWEVPKNK